MTDWIFYDGQADDMMREAERYGANPKKIKDKDIRSYAKRLNLDFKNLKVAYEDRKHTFKLSSWLSKEVS